LRAKLLEQRAGDEIQREHDAKRHLPPKERA
jgi:hypothetical protein